MPNYTPTRFAAVYIRVSTDDQAELSPDTQLEKIREYARKEGFLILQDHIYVDAGISGKKAEKRPEFMRMIAAAKEKDRPFSAVLLWKFSRFARNQEESIFYKSVLRSKCGVDVVSITEPLIAGHFGSLIERIIEWMDEFYSIRLSEEVKRSMEVNARRGKLQSTPSFGYAAKDGKLEIVPEEAEIIRYIFDRFNSGVGLFAIARELTAMGIRTHRGNLFENRTVEYILRNPVYIGKLRWNPTGRTRRNYFDENIITADGEHEPLIARETWDAAQRRLDEMKAQARYKGKPTTSKSHWIIGTVRCAACGASLVNSGGYLRCNNYVRGRCRHTQSIRPELLVDALTSRLRLDADLTDGLTCDVVYSIGNGGADLARLQAAEKHLQSKKARLQEAYLSGVLDLDDFAAAKKDLEEQLSQTQQEISEFEQRSDADLIRATLQNSIRSTLKTLESEESTPEQKSAALGGIIGNCTFDKAAGTLSVTYRLIF